MDVNPTNPEIIECVVGKQVRFNDSHQITITDVETPAKVEIVQSTHMPVNRQSDDVRSGSPDLIDESNPVIRNGDLIEIIAETRSGRNSVNVKCPYCSVQNTKEHLRRHFSRCKFVPKNVERCVRCTLPFYCEKQKKDHLKRRYKKEKFIGARRVKRIYLEFVHQDDNITSTNVVERKVTIIR